MIFKGFLTISCFKLIRFETAEQPEVWSGKISLPIDKVVQFRYFVCMSLDNMYGVHEKVIVMRRWETAIKPRTIKRHKNGIDPKIRKYKNFDILFLFVRTGRL